MCSQGGLQGPLWGEARAVLCQTHCRAQLCLAVKMVAPMGKHMYERVKKAFMRETVLQSPRSENKEEEVFQVPDQRFPCSLWWRLWWGSCPPAFNGKDHGDSRCPSAAHGEDHWWCRLSSSSPWRTTVEQRSTLQPMGSPCQNRLLAVPREESGLQQTFW